jgi:hypothetical protein
MKRTVRSVVALVAVAVVVSAVSAGAAFKKEEKSKFKMGGALGKMMGMFMGRQMREGTVTTVAVKGDRKLTRSGDTGRLIDLAEERVYEIDFKKKSYTVLTFEQVRQKMKEEQEKLKKQQAEMQAEREKNPDQKMPEYDFEVSNKLTGEAKEINGFQTRQMITTITMKEKGKTVEQGGAMVMTTDQWITPKIPGAREEIDFELRYLKKIGMVDLVQEMAMASAMYPGMVDMMKRMKVEGDQLDGTPIYAVTSFEAVASPEQQKQQEKQQAESDSGGGGGLTGMFARKMMKKKKDEPAAEGGDAAASKGQAPFMTLTSEVLSASSDVADAELAIPDGFKLKD